jgi:hypothetical protein
MNQFLKWISVILMLTFIQSGFAQNNTISPYSKLGLGEFESIGFGRNAAMGNTGIALRSAGHINILNPASYTEIDSTMVMFDMGVHGERTQLNNGYQSGAKNNANLSYLSLGFAVNSRLAMAGGIIPYTSVGYDIEFESDINGLPSKYHTKMSGSGGLTCMYGGIAYRPFKNTSFGFNAELLFGPKEESVQYYISKSDDFTVYEDKMNSYSGFKVDLGFQQVFKLSDKQVVVLGLTANTPGVLQNRYDYTAVKIYSGLGTVDTLKYEDNQLQSITLPTNYAVGLAYHLKDRLVLTGDVHYNPFSQMHVSDEFARLVDNYVLNFGAEYRPKTFGARYELAYRAGAGFESGYYQINDQTLKKFSTTAGVGFRIRSLRFNVYGAYQWQGTFKSQLIQESNYRVGINISFIDYWFQQRKFY